MSDKITNTPVDVIVPIIRTTTSLTLQYVNRLSGEVLHETDLFDDINSFGVTVGQALDATSSYLENKLSHMDRYYTFDTEEEFEEESFFKEIGPYVLDEELFSPDDLEDSYTFYSSYGEEDSFYVNEYKESSMTDGDKVVDILDFMNKRGR